MRIGLDIVHLASGVRPRAPQAALGDIAGAEAAGLGTVWVPVLGRGPDPARRSPCQRLRSAAYGSDPRGHSGFEVLVRVQELLCISYVLERLIAGAPAGQELTSRLQAVRKTGTPAPWHPLPPVDPQPQAQAE